MSLKGYRTTSLFLIISFFISACGGSQDGNDFGGFSAPLEVPIAVITAESVVAEGTTSIPLDASNSTDGDGDVISFSWLINDDDGIADLAISDTSLISPLLTGIPESISRDLNIIISLSVGDNDIQSSEIVTQTITVLNATPTDVDVSSFNGSWQSPCFNTTNNTSVEQLITINGDVLTGIITNFSAGEIPAFNCELPLDQAGDPDTTVGLEQTADIDATLGFGSNVSVSSCLNGVGVNTDITIGQIVVGSQTLTSEDDINGFFQLFSTDVDILPNPANICRSGDNLLIGNALYTPVL